MKLMRVVLATCAVLAATSSVAKASLVYVGFVDVGAAGFGNKPRMLTLQTNIFETGYMTPVDITHDDAIGNFGGNKASTPTLSALEWKTGADVGIGFNSDQTGGSGITLQELTLNIYGADKTTLEGTFSLASPMDFSATDLGGQQGNGNAVFLFGLNSSQQTEFNNIVADSGSGGFYAALSASLGCEPVVNKACTGTGMESNDGPDSFVAVNRSGNFVPDGGMTLMLLGGALFGLETLRRRFAA